MSARRASTPAFTVGERWRAVFTLLVVSVATGGLIAALFTPLAFAAKAGSDKAVTLLNTVPAGLGLITVPQKTMIYAKKNGKNVLLASFYAQDRESIPFSQMDEAVRNATVAGEDVRYYQHGGTDPQGLLRAAVDNLAHKGGDTQGGSTITMQYVKNVCVQQATELSTTKAEEAAYQDCIATTFARKTANIRDAIALEKKYSKDQILAAYLNIVGFGGRIYGIQSAARYYFNTTAAKLTPAQSASLVAIVNDPQDLRLDVKSNLAANKVRRDYILGAEYKAKFITKSVYETAVATAVKPVITPSKIGCMAAGTAGFFCDYVERVLETNPVFGATSADRLRNLNSGGLKVYTTLNLSLQASAQKTMNTYIPKTSTLLKIGSSAVSLQVGTGRILAMVENKTYNNTSSATKTETSVNYNANELLGSSVGFQPGSTFKLFTLLDWIRSGHSIYSYVNGNQRTIPATDFTQCGKPDTKDSPWNLGNDEGAAENGTYSVVQATAKSVNGAFGTMAENLDLCDIRDIAESMGVYAGDGSQLNDNPTFVIGQSSSVSPMSLASAYSTVANNGVTCAPIAIDSIVTSTGKKVAVPSADCHRVIAKKVTDQAKIALHATLTSGTATGDQTADGYYEFGKTGTTDNAYSTFMMGSTSKVTTGVWVGSYSGHANTRALSFGYCAAGGGSAIAVQRHCLWKGIQTAANKIYGD